MDESGGLLVDEMGVWPLYRMLRSDVIRPAWRLMTAARNYWWYLRHQSNSFMSRPESRDRAFTKTADAAQDLATIVGDERRKDRMFTAALQAAACACIDRATCPHLRALVGAIMEP